MLSYCTVCLFGEKLTGKFKSFFRPRTNLSKMPQVHPPRLDDLFWSFSFWKICPSQNPQPPCKRREVYQMPGVNNHITQFRKHCFDQKFCPFQLSGKVWTNYYVLRPPPPNPNHVTNTRCHEYVFSDNTLCSISWPESLPIAIIQVDKFHALTSVLDDWNGHFFKSKQCFSHQNLWISFQWLKPKDMILNVDHFREGECRP